MASAGYAYMFNRGSSIDVGLTAGVESGAFIVGAGLGFRFGVFHASVVNGGASGSKRGKKAAAKAEGEKTEAGASGKVEAGTGGK